MSKVKQRRRIVVPGQISPMIWRMTSTNKGAINCSDANLHPHKDEIQARVTAGTISMTGGLLPTTSHFVYRIQ